jgi:hypothetical protein
MVATIVMPQHNLPENRPDREIVIVSGLPRSGTSLMMQMLDRGGLGILTDGIRAADTDNPKGYYELEAVKRTKQDPSWLDGAAGKGVKMVSLLLYDLPATWRYRVIFMERAMEEVLASQRKMLEHLGRDPGRDDETRRFFALHLEKLRGWLSKQSHFAVLPVSHNQLLAQPLIEAQRVSRFLGETLDAAKMASVVDLSLYRNRKP